MMKFKIGEVKTRLQEYICAFYNKLEDDLIHK